MKDIFIAYLTAFVMLVSTNSYSNADLLLAIRNGDLEQTLEILEDSPSDLDVNYKDPRTDFDFVPLRFAVQNNWMEIVQKLFDLGADIHFEDRRGRGLLAWIRYPGSPEMLELLVNLGADINKKDNTGHSIFLNVAGDLTTLGTNAPIQQAMLQKTIELGANLSDQNNIGENAAHLCLAGGNFCDYKKIADLGIDFAHIDNFGNNIFHKYCSLSRYYEGEEVRMDFYRQQIDGINLKNNYGDTPLIHCLKDGHYYAGEEYPKYGADVSILSQEGEAAFEVAMKHTWNTRFSALFPDNIELLSPAFVRRINYQSFLHVMSFSGLSDKILDTLDHFKAVWDALDFNDEEFFNVLIRSRHSDLSSILEKTGVSSGRNIVGQNSIELLVLTNQWQKNEAVLQEMTVSLNPRSEYNLMSYAALVEDLAFIKKYFNKGLSNLMTRDGVNAVAVAKLLGHNEILDFFTSKGLTSKISETVDDESLTKDLESAKYIYSNLQPNISSTNEPYLRESISFVLTEALLNHCLAERTGSYICSKKRSIGTKGIETTYYRDSWFNLTYRATLPRGAVVFGGERLTPTIFQPQFFSYSTRSYLRYIGIRGAIFGFLTGYIVPTELTQIESIVPELINSFDSHASGLNIVALDAAASNLPLSKINENELQEIRQLAVDVCELIHEFCDTRVRLHNFPQTEELNVVRDWISRLQSDDPDHLALNALIRLEELLVSYLSQTLSVENYESSLSTRTLDYLEGFGDLDSLSLDLHPQILEFLKNEQMLTQKENEIVLLRGTGNFKQSVLRAFQKGIVESPPNDYKESLNHALLLAKAMLSLDFLRPVEYKAVVKNLNKIKSESTANREEFKNLIRKVNEWVLLNCARFMHKGLKPSYFPQRIYDLQFKAVEKEIVEHLVRPSILKNWGDLESVL